MTSAEGAAPPGRPAVRAADGAAVGEVPPPISYGPWPERPILSAALDTPPGQRLGRGSGVTSILYDLGPAFRADPERAVRELSRRRRPG